MTTTAQAFSNFVDRISLTDVQKLIALEVHYGKDRPLKCAVPGIDRTDLGLREQDHVKGGVAATRAIVFTSVPRRPGR